MTIYARTSYGNEVMRNREGQVSRRVKTLLICIDGKTDSSVYISSLSSFGDVSELLASLQNDRLIEVVGSAGSLSFNNPSRAAPDGADSDFPDTSDFDASMSPANGTPDWQATVSQAYNQALLPEATAAGLPSERRLQGTGAPGQAQARAAISLMSDFVSRYFPEQAMELLLEIEQLDTPEQLLASLKSYEAFIAPVGTSADQHLAQVRATLSGA